LSRPKPQAGLSPSVPWTDTLGLRHCAFDVASCPALVLFPFVGFVASIPSRPLDCSTHPDRSGAADCRLRNGLSIPNELAQHRLDWLWIGRAVSLRTGPAARKGQEGNPRRACGIMKDKHVASR
jgi:hypothetical protein